MDFIEKMKNMVSEGNGDQALEWLDLRSREDEATLGRWVCDYIEKQEIAISIQKSNLESAVGNQRQEIVDDIAEKCVKCAYFAIAHNTRMFFAAECVELLRDLAKTKEAAIMAAILGLYSATECDKFYKSENNVLLGNVEDCVKYLMHLEDAKNERNS